MPDTIVDTARNENPPVPFVKIQGIKKSFGNVVALSGVDLAVYPGQITAIVGDNGSGKSTLINILSGNLKPDAGTIYIEDKSFTYLTPKQSMAAGISTVYQDLSLDDYRNVTANIFLGNELTRFGLLSRREMRLEASRLIQALDIELPDINLPTAFNAAEGIEIVSVQPGDWDSTTAYNIAADLITAHPDLKAIFCCNDVMALAASQALIDAGVKDGILIYGVDGTEEAKTAIKEGRMDGTITYPSSSYAKAAVVMLLKLAQGMDMSQTIYCPLDIINTDNVSEFDGYK